MGELFSYFLAGFFAVWGVIVIVNTKDTANTIYLKLFTLLVSMSMFILSGLMLNAAIQ